MKRGLARLKKPIFDKCDVVIISRDDRMTTYAGGMKNSPVPCMHKEDGTVLKVTINGLNFNVDPIDWTVVNDA